MSTVSEIEEERKVYQEQLDLVRGQLRDDSTNPELHSLQEELTNLVDFLNENIAELKRKQAPKPAAQAPASPPSQPNNTSRESPHPATFNNNSNNKSAVPAPEEKDDVPVNYQVNDNILAKWVSGDKGFYPARITSITGSSTSPIYIVKFKGYENTETLRARDIRPLNNKRKAEGASGASPAQTTQRAPPGGAAAASAPGVISSAGATIYPGAKKELAEKEAEDSLKPPKPKKIKAKKELESGKNKWQEFNAKSKFGKSQKKDSMFRTPEGVKGRVGFTGSGQAMRKDQARTRHIYEMNEDLD